MTMRHLGGEIMCRSLTLAFLFALAAQNAIAGANQAPTATLTSPTTGASFIAPATVSLAATASDADGTVVRVDFFAGTTLIGSSSTPPYQATWSNVAAGTYSITAKAVDNAGATGTSAAASITVASATSLVITSPANGAFVDLRTNLTVSGTYEGLTTSNTILVDDPYRSNIATISGNTYSSNIFTPNALAVGANTLTVRLERADRTNVSRSITVFGYQPPVVAFTAPASATFAAPATVTFAVDAKAPGGTVTQVRFQRNGVNVGTVTAPPYQITLPSLGAGSYTIGAFADTNRGVSDGAQTTIQVLGPNQLPTISITSPASGSAFVAGSNVPVTVSASDPDGTVTLVEFLDGATIVATTNVAPFSFTWVNPGLGSHTLTARATDNRGGQTSSAPVTISVVPPNVAPSVSLTSPSNGAVFTAPASITLSADAADSDGTIAKVEFFQGSTLVGTVTAAPYTFTWSSVAQGNYSLTAKATDDRGTTTTSTAISITVNPPPVIILGPVNGATVPDDRVLVTGQINAPQYSGIQVNGVVAFTDSNGNFYANNVPLVAGANTLTATLTRIDGSTTVYSINTASTGAPAIRIDATPLEGLAPLTVGFNVSPTGGALFSRADYDFNGDGTIDYTLFPPGGMIGLNYTAGVYTATVTATDSLGRVVQRRFAINAEANPDSKLASVFNGMTSRLRAGDVDGAASFFTGGAADQYRDLFTALKQAGTLTTAVDGLGTLQGSTVGPDFGELILTRDSPNGPIAFPIWFLRGPDGIWRIEGM